ncbi:hypothetical protein [Archangium lansingense]|uniref:GDSL-like lipase/acylhydrolase family protein n=1 Tax=Archangium lansingense TaxID=2995310 RepID=A0ABT4AHG4_9BACT|nr:hypothetical protein [Archangium lansinium]MCY1081117.1 hypothetical protein [Archangium lansinium]
MKLFTIGDSISQGFRSLAAARTDQSYSTLIARVLRADPYRYPSWPHGGLPVDLELLMRRLESRYGSDIGGFEWTTVLQTINGVLDEAEDYYERGEGNEHRPYPSDDRFWHNTAFWGATVADAWQVTPAVCKQSILAAKNNQDEFLGPPNAAFYRTALKVLNPQLDPALDGISQLGWLEQHAQDKNEGVENLLLWLGANNALETVLRLRIQQTPNNPSNRPYRLGYFERKAFGWNLWHPNDFAEEYEQLLSEVERIMARNTQKNWRVFVGTVPEVTIAPVAKGVGETFKIDGSTYYKYYTYFPFEEEFALTTKYQLTTQEALHVDRCIHQYNDTIKSLVKAANARAGQQRFFVVDLCKALHDIAWKRNDGQPQYQYPSYFDFIYPKVDSKYYHADETGRLRQGGLASLDGVHPTAIGQGLIAWEILKVMRAAGVQVHGVPINPDALDWRAIFAGDSLYSSPIRIMKELYQHPRLAEMLVKLFDAWLE